MSLPDVEEIAMKLSETDRAQLATALLESISSDVLEDRPDELDLRERELDSGLVAEISYQELLAGVKAARHG